MQCLRWPGELAERLLFECVGIRYLLTLAQGSERAAKVYKPKVVLIATSKAIGSITKILGDDDRNECANAAEWTKLPGFSLVMHDAWAFPKMLVDWVMWLGQGLRM